tara:strand:+ start:6107 stop:6346 length:240 start_codon:yes stop_codon:yes gene_type:complete
MAKQQISDADLIDIIDRLDASYDRLSGSGKSTLDKFIEKMEKGFNQKDLTKFLSSMQMDYDRMGTDAKEAFDMLSNAKL